MKRLKNLFSFKWLLVLMAISLFLLVWQIGKRQELRKSAGGTKEVRVSFYGCSPQDLQVGQECSLSALVFDNYGRPIFGGYRYEWSISSTGSLGELIYDPNDKIATFKVKGEGSGDLTVSAISQNSLSQEVILKSTRIVVGEELQQSNCQRGDGIIKVTPFGGEGECHDIQQAIDTALDNDEVYLRAGRYQVPAHYVDDKKIGLYVNKKIFFLGDYPHAEVNIQNVDYGIYFDQTDISISGWKILLQDIKHDGVIVSGSLFANKSNNVHLGLLEIGSLGSVPTLLHFFQVRGTNNIGEGISGIYHSKFVNGEKAAIELDYVENINIIGNRIYNSGIGIYNSHAPAFWLNIENNEITGVYSGINLSGELSNQEVVYKISQVNLVNNHIFNHGEDYSLNEAKYHFSSPAGIYLAYSDSSSMVVGNLVENGDRAIHLDGVDNTVLKNNLLVNNHSSIAMSGGKALFINNTIYGNENSFGGGNYITKDSVFKNNIVAKVGNLREGNIISNYCGLMTNHESCESMKSGQIKYNDFYNNERNFCLGTIPVIQCEFALGEGGNISADPLFGPDFCLRPGSLALGSGEGGVNIGAKEKCSGNPDCICSNSEALPFHAKGDGDCDGKTDLVDYNYWVESFIRRNKAYDENADFNCNGVVNISDYGFWRSNFSW